MAEIALQSAGTEGAADVEVTPRRQLDLTGAADRDGSRVPRGGSPVQLDLQAATAVVELDLDLAFADDRILVLRDLIALPQVGI